MTIRLVIYEVDTAVGWSRRGGLIVGVERMRRTSIIMLCGTAHSSRKAKTLSLIQITSLTVTASILAMSWGILTLRQNQVRDAERNFWRRG